MKREHKETLLTIPICIIIGLLINMLGSVGIFIIFFLAFGRLADLAIWIAKRLVDYFE